MESLTEQSGMVAHLVGREKAFKPFGWTGPTQSSKSLWAWVDSNYRPHAYQACALTT